MTRPDRTDILGMLEYLNHRIDEVRESARKMIDLSAMTRYGIEELAEVQELAPCTVSRSPWKLPNFGRPDIMGKRRLWLGSTVRAWYERPEDERRAEWDAMSAAERRKAMGKA